MTRPPHRDSPQCLGHHYDPETLVCTHEGCERSWEQERIQPSVCEGTGLHPNKRGHGGPGAPCDPPEPDLAELRVAKALRAAQERLLRG